MDSVDSEADCVILYQDLSALWKSVNMHARKWASNPKLVSDVMPENDRTSTLILMLRVSCG